MLCPICHTQNRENARFCKGCGYSFPPAGQEPASQPQAAQSSPTLSAQQASTAAQQAPVEQAPAQPAPAENEAVDPSLAPTMILTPQEMMAYHARRWQQELAREQQTTSGGSGDSADAPTLRATPMPAPVQASTPPATSAPDIADMPTVLMSPQLGDDAPTVVTAPPPPPPTGASAPPPPPPAASGADASVSATSPYAEQSLPASVSPVASKAPDTLVQNDNAAPTASEAAQGTPTGESNVEQQEQQQEPSVAEAPEQTGDFPALAVGTLVANRYEITQLLGEDGHEHTYQVTDHQGYKHCWNCGSQQNAEGDEFCIDCGAELLEGSYVMHEYAAASKQADSRVVPSNIIDTFVDQGKTYAIEQPQATQAAFPDGVHLVAACESDAGNVRRSEPNEDSTLVLQLQRVHESIASPAGVFIVADGLGGHDNGQVASRMTIGVISERMVRDLLEPPLASEKVGESPKALDEDELVTLFRSAVEDANAALVQVNQRDKTDMGSTITGFMIVGQHAFILNVGDSRTYMLREDNLYQLTTDHSLVGQLVAGGLIEPDDVYTHPQRSQIYRSLGDKAKVQIDITKQEIMPGDILLSCSDGLWEMVRNPQIKEILSKAPDPQTACSRLIETANNNGGEDNVSAVVVFVR